MCKSGTLHPSNTSSVRTGGRLNMYRAGCAWAVGPWGRPRRPGAESQTRNGAWRSLIIGKWRTFRVASSSPSTSAVAAIRESPSPIPPVRAPVLAHELGGAPGDPLRYRERAQAGQQAADLPPLRRSHVAGDFGQADRAHAERGGLLELALSLAAPTYFPGSFARCF